MEDTKEVESYEIGEISATSSVTWKKQPKLTKEGKVMIKVK